MARAKKLINSHGRTIAALSTNHLKFSQLTLVVVLNRVGKSNQLARYDVNLLASQLCATETFFPFVGKVESKIPSVLIHSGLLLLKTDTVSSLPGKDHTSPTCTISSGAGLSGVWARAFSELVPFLLEEKRVFVTNPRLAVIRNPNKSRNTEAGNLFLGRWTGMKINF